MTVMVATIESDQIHTNPLALWVWKTMLLIGSDVYHHFDSTSMPYDFTFSINTFKEMEYTGHGRPWQQQSTPAAGQHEYSQHPYNFKQGFWISQNNKRTSEWQHNTCNSHNDFQINTRIPLRPQNNLKYPYQRPHNPEHNSGTQTNKIQCNSHNDSMLPFLQTMASPFLSSKCLLTHYNLKVWKYSFFNPNLISPFQTVSEANSYHTTDSCSTKLKPSFVLLSNEMGEINGVLCWAAASCMHCSSESLLL